MNKVKNQVNLDKTLAFTKSSFAYKDPYMVDGSLVYKVRNAVQSFIASRQIENEFVDFKTYNLERQFKDIHTSVYKAFAKNDKVNLQRSLSEPMFQYAVSIRTDKHRNPFLKEVTGFKTLQSRVYSENDHLLPEEQWAQITVCLTGRTIKDVPATHYTVFERRVADKLDYFDWKISLMANEADFKMINDVKI